MHRVEDIFGKFGVFDMEILVELVGYKIQLVRVLLDFLVKAWKTKQIFHKIVLLNSNFQISEKIGHLQIFAQFFVW